MLTRETSNRSRHRDVFPVHQVKCFLTGQKAAGGCENLTHIENRAEQTTFQIPSCQLQLVSDEPVKITPWKISWVVSEWCVCGKQKS